MKYYYNEGATRWRKLPNGIDARYNRAPDGWGDCFVDLITAVIMIVILIISDRF